MHACKHPWTPPGGQHSGVSAHPIRVEFAFELQQGLLVRGKGGPVSSGGCKGQHSAQQQGGILCHVRSNVAWQHIPWVAKQHRALNISLMLPVRHSLPGLSILGMTKLFQLSKELPARAPSAAWPKGARGLPITMLTAMAMACKQSISGHVGRVGTVQNSS